MKIIKLLNYWRYPTKTTTTCVLAIWRLPNETNLMNNTIVEPAMLDRMMVDQNVYSLDSYLLMKRTYDRNSNHCHKKIEYDECITWIHMMNAYKEWIKNCSCLIFSIQNKLSFFLSLVLIYSFDGFFIHILYLLSTLLKTERGEIKKTT